jgi:hypothetical protein
LAAEILPNIITRKHPKKGRENKIWGKDKSPGKNLADCLLAHHNDAFLAGSTL